MQRIHLIILVTIILIAIALLAPKAKATELIEKAKKAETQKIGTLYF